MQVEKRLSEDKNAKKCLNCLFVYSKDRYLVQHLMNREKCRNSYPKKDLTEILKKICPNWKISMNYLRKNRLKHMIKHFQSSEYSCFREISEVTQSKTDGSMEIQDENQSKTGKSMEIQDENQSKTSKDNSKSKETSNEIIEIPPEDEEVETIDFTKKHCSNCGMEFSHHLNLMQHLIKMAICRKNFREKELNGLIKAICPKWKGISSTKDLSSPDQEHLYR